MLTLAGWTIFALACMLGCLPFSGLLTLPCAVVLYLAARRDLALMTAGRMDPTGRVGVHTSRSLAIANLWLAGFNFVWTVALLGLQCLRAD
jgi:hypothetical protein